MKKGEVWGFFWKIFTIFVILTWVLWFFEIDIRDIKPVIKNEFNDMNADLELGNNLNTHSLELENQQSVVEKKEEELMIKCRKSYETCKDISIQKFEGTISLIKYEQFEKGGPAVDFFNTWSDLQMNLEGLMPGDFMSRDLNNLGNYLPIVLFATKIEKYGPYGMVSPYVLMCINTGELTEPSKRYLGCLQ